MDKLLIIVIDGCSSDYISKENTPNFYRIAKSGFCKCAKSSIPSVTNVNHATILSGKFPYEHGIVGNYYYNKETGKQDFIENSGFIKTDTIFDVLHRKGAKTALLAVNANIMEVFGRNVDFSISVQKPNEILVRFLDMEMPPKVGTLKASGWILEACHNLIKKNNPDVVYCTTSDYMMHNFAPNTNEAITHMQEIDKWIGKIYDLDPKREIYITADHGMNKKSKIVNLQAIMDRMKYEVVCHPPIKDRYIENHVYQEGGVLYLYFKEAAKDKKDEIIKFIEEYPCVESVCTKEEAAKKYNLPMDKIGDYVVFAGEDYAFGELDGEELETDCIRTHGSLYERAIPLIAVNAREEAAKYRYSRDIVRIILEKIES